MTRRAARGRRADFARKIGADYSRRWPNCNVAGSPLFTLAGFGRLACRRLPAPLREGRNAVQKWPNLVRVQLLGAQARKQLKIRRASAATKLMTAAATPHSLPASPARWNAWRPLRPQHRISRPLRPSYGIPRAEG